jgi:hypothetical protein
MLITPEKVGVERLYCAVRSDWWAKPAVWQNYGIFILQCNINENEFINIDGKY